MSSRWTPLRMALAYALAGAVWIVVSDRVLEWMLRDERMTLAAQTLKGLLYIGGTTLLVYWLARAEMSARGRETALESERGELDAALRHSERLRARIERIVHFGTWQWEISDDVVSWSDGMYEIFGLDPSSPPPAFQRHDPLFHPDDMERLRAGVDRAIAEGEPYELEVRAIRTDGEARTCIVRGEPDRAPDGTVVRLFGSCHDISDRKRAEGALASSERRFRSVVEGAPDAIFVQTYERFAYVNPACVRLLGAESEAELLGEPVVDRFHPVDRAAVRARIQALNEKRRPAGPRAETMLTVDGREVPVEVSATPIEHEGEAGALVHVRDVTDRRRQELERERLHRAVEFAGEAIVVTDVEGTIEYVNPAFERITGFSREEVLGENPRIQKSGEHVPNFYEQMWKTITRGDIWHGRVVNRRKDGEAYTADVTISPVRDPSGEIVNFVAVERDMTRELDLENQLLQTQKMESIGSLAGGIAHDFNNMLTVILGNLRMLSDATPEDDPRRGDLEEIQKAAERSSELVGQLLGFARRQLIAPRALTLNDAVEERLEMLGRLLGEDLTLSWRPMEDLWSVRIDPAQLDQVLTNLLVNARDAVADVGSVAIETRNVEFDEAYCADHVGFRPGEYAMLAVSDTGCGMDDATTRRIFEPFFTTKESGRGTGLGLSTVYGIVRQNRGFINVYSEPGKGSTFRIYLPRHEKDAASEERPAAGPDREGGGQETILLVEDSEALIKIATRQLQQLGYTVLAAQDPEEAIRLVEEHGDGIDLLLTDVVMPGMNGRTLFERLAKERPDLRCLYMSGYTADVIAHRGVLDDGVNFLQKPFTDAELAEALRYALGRDS